MISRKAKIGKDVDIHPLAYIEEDAEIGDNTQIGPFCIVRKNAKIGKIANLQLIVKLEIM